MKLRQTLFQPGQNSILTLFGHGYIELCIVGVLLLTEAKGIWAIGDMYKEKRTGPSTEPWGL